MNPSDSLENNSDNGMSGFIIRPKPLQCVFYLFVATVSFEATLKQFDSARPNRTFFYNPGVVEFARCQSIENHR